MSAAPDRHPAAERAVAVLLWLAALSAVLFVVAFAADWPLGWMAVTLGGALGMVAAALIVAGTRLVVVGGASEPRPTFGEPADQGEVAELVTGEGGGLSRRHLIVSAALAAGGALLAAAVTPLASLGPSVGDALGGSPWAPGRLLVGEDGQPLLASALNVGAFATAFPEGASRRDLAAPVVVVRVAPEMLRLPPERRDWAPGGIMAFSKICTHAACAVSLFRYPVSAATSPGPALVCPCHYSTFDVVEGGHVIFGPAVRALPQLPLSVDAAGRLVAAGDFSGPIGPSWLGIRT